MADTPTARLGARKPEPGVKVDWGAEDGTNETFDAFDEAIAGVQPISITGNYTPTNTNFETNEQRQAVLVFTDGGLSAQPTITVASVEKTWWIDCSAISSYDILIKTSGGSSATVRKGQKTKVICDGTDCAAVDPTLDQIKPAAADVDAGGHKITNGAAATASTDFAIKSQVDAVTAAVASDAASAAASAAAAAADLVLTNADVVSTGADAAAAATSASNAATSETNAASSWASISAISTDIGTVAGISGDVSTAAGDSINISTVAGISANVTTVAGDSTNIGTVAGISADVTTVADNMADVQDAASLVTYASQAQAEAGTATDVMMNPLRTKQAIDELGSGAGWVQIGSPVATTSGSSVEFLSIPDTYTELRFNFDAVGGTSSTYPKVAVSSDNGTTYSSTANLTYYTSGSFSGMVFLLGYNEDKYGIYNATAVLSTDDAIQSVGGSQIAYVARSDGGTDAVKFSLAAGTFNAGSITLYGR